MRAMGAFYIAIMGAALSACAVTDHRSDGAGQIPKGPRDWSNVSINMLIDKYGRPDLIETDRVTWNRRGPWKKIVVWDAMEYVERDSGKSNLEEFVVYHVPADKRDALHAFSGNLHISEDGEQVSSRSTDESRNFLTLNLADRIVRGELDAKAAHEAYVRNLQLADAGKSSPDMSSLLFPRQDAPSQEAVIKE
jgi:hypothetical protein